MRLDLLRCSNFCGGTLYHKLREALPRLHVAILDTPRCGFWRLCRFFPNVKVPQKPDSGYAETLSVDYGGEWTYRKEWKPDILPDPDMGWIRAIHTAQKALRSRKIGVPILLMHSAESVKKGDGKEKYRVADAILDVESISKYGKRLGDDVTEITFDGGLHDLALSRKEIRNDMYRVMLDWLSAHGL